MQLRYDSISVGTWRSNLAIAACIGSFERSALITSSCAIFQSKGIAGVVGSEFEAGKLKGRG